MTTIGIQQLCQIQHSSSSSMTGSPLKGTLYLISQEKNMEFKRGSVHLVDKTTKESIPCVIDRFFPEFHKQTITIKKWNYIFDEPSGYKYVEFATDDAYRGVSEFSILRNHFIKENQTFRSFKKQSYYTPHANMSSKDNNIVGKVKAISILFVQPEVAANFFVELTDIQGLESVYIKFSGNQLVKYHSYFRIGSIYTFQGLGWTTVLKQDMFLYNDIARCCTITQSQYTNNVTIIQHTYPSNMSSVVNENISFTGYITRVIDSVFGIYELDHKLILCLFHYLGYSQDKPYRINTKIHITHFHGIVIRSNGNSNLLNLWQMKKDCAVLITCMRTHIEIIKFPTNCDIPVENMETIDLKNSIYTHIIQRQSTFSQLIRQLEIYATLVTKFNSIDWKQKEFINMFTAIRNYVFETTHTDYTGIQTNLVHDFLQHDCICSVIGSEIITHIDIDDYPTLEKIKSDLNQQLEPYQLDIPSGNGLYELDNVDIKSASYKQSNSYLLGLIEMTRDGRLVLKDDGSSILLTTATCVEFGGIYIIRQAHMFQEDLSFLDTKSGIKQDIKSTYLTCDSKDLCLVRRPLSPRLQIQDEFNPHQVIGFNCIDPNLQSYVVVHVLDSYPIQIVLQKKGVFDMEVRMTVEVYNFGEKNKKRKAILVTSSKTNSLEYSKKLQVDDWGVISGLRKDEMIYFLDGNIHHVFQISIRPEKIPNATLIVPIQGPPSPIDKTREVYNVSQFSVESLLPDESFMKKSYMFYNVPINVRGVVISKRIMNGLGVTGLLEPHAMKLYKGFGIGTGYFDRNIQIQLRQEDSLDFITIYIQANKLHYPLGLVPGATVTIRNLIRKPTANKFEFYCSTLSTSTIQVETTRQNKEDIALENVETHMLSEFHQNSIDSAEKEDRIFRVCCYVKAIISVELKWKCRYCDSVIRCGDCHGMCIDAPRVFIASAFVEVSDGTNNATATIDGERLVFRLLQLREAQVTTLKRITTSYGQINYSGWSGSRIATLEEIGTEELNKKQKQEMHGYTLDDIFSKAREVGYIWVYGKTIRPTLKRKRQLVDHVDEQVNHVFNGLHNVNMSDNGSLLKSWEMNKLKIKVLEIECTDARSQAYGQLMNALVELTAIAPHSK